MAAIVALPGEVGLWAPALGIWALGLAWAALGWQQRIEPGVVEGASVRQGQVIGTVGNSGTPASVSSKTSEVHLHMELWVGDPTAGSFESASDGGSAPSHFVGRFLRPIEARVWLEKILR